MTYAPTYPNPGVQHTRAVLALTATQACLEEYMITEDMDDETRFRRWAALVWAALTFVEDVCNTCPVYARCPQWRYLRQTVNTLAEGLRKLEPGMDEEGTRIYEEAA